METLGYQMRGLLDRLNVGVFLASSDGQVKTANRAFFELLAVPDERRANGAWSFGEIGRAGLVRRMCRRPTGKPWQRELHVSPLPGDDRWLRFTVVVLAPDEGGMPLLQGIVEDTTEPKRTEEELRRSQSGLRELAGHLQSVREEERWRIASVIHDEVGQLLSGLRLDLGWLGVRTRSATIRERLAAMTAQIDSGIDLARRIAQEMHPHVLDHEGLAAAIDWQVSRYRDRARCTFDVVVAERLPALESDLEASMFRIFQELVTNALRHADATRITVRLEPDGAQLVLTVRDNGRGIRSEEIWHPLSFGLLESRERARQWGGVLEISGVAGEGTVARLWIPLATRH